MRSNKRLTPLSKRDQVERGMVRREKKTYLGSAILLVGSFLAGHDDEFTES